MPATVTMICPNLKCGQTVVAPESARGKVVRCAHCQQVFMVPAGRSIEPEPGLPSENESRKRPSPR